MVYVYTVDRFWLRPFLWQLWRLGSVGVNEMAFIRFLRSHCLDMPLIEGVCAQGYIETTICKPDVGYKLTSKGLDYVLEGETPIWKERLKGVLYKDPESPFITTAVKLRDAGVTLNVISDVIGRDAREVLDGYELELRLNARANAEIQSFLDGKLSLRDLNVYVIFNDSQVLTGALNKVRIHTLVELLGIRVSDLTRKRGIGYNHLTRIRERLESYGEVLEP